MCKSTVIAEFYWITYPESHFDIDNLRGPQKFRNTYPEVIKKEISGQHWSGRIDHDSGALIAVADKVAKFAGRRHVKKTQGYSHFPLSSCACCSCVCVSSVAFFFLHLHLRRLKPASELWLHKSRLVFLWTENRHFSHCVSLSRRLAWSGFLLRFTQGSSDGPHVCVVWDGGSCRYLEWHSRRWNIESISSISELLILCILVYVLHWARCFPL